MKTTHEKEISKEGIIELHKYMIDRFREYDSFEDIQKDYPNMKDVTYLKGATPIIKIPNTNRLIIIKW